MLYALPFTIIVLLIFSITGLICFTVRRNASQRLPEKSNDEKTGDQP